MRWPVASICLAAATFAACGAVQPAKGQSSQGIVAVVNDEVISGYDLEARLRFTVFSAKLPNRPEVYNRLRSQVLNNLIGDSVRLQEAARLGIQVSPKEIEEAKRTIEERNGIEPQSLDNILTSNGIDRLTLIRQIKAELAWVKIVNRRVRPRIQVGEDEVTEAMARIAANKGKPEHLLSEIFLGFVPQTPETEVKALADRLLNQLSRGASFNQLANTFSQSASAANGGNLGWLRNDQLDDAIAPVVARMEPGQISLPIKALDGYHIILLRDRRVGAGVVSGTTTVTLQQIFLPFAAGAADSEVSSQMALAEQAGRQANSCDEMAKLGKELGSPASGRLENVNVDGLAPELQRVVRDLPLGQSSAPIRSNVGVIVLMVCDRQGEISEEDAAEAVRRSLVLERLDLAARRYLRNLRREAFVEIRR